MKSVSGKEFCKALERHGWVHDRTRGSHHIYHHPGRNISVSVPVHGNYSLGTGLQKRLMRQTGLTDDDL